MTYPAWSIGLAAGPSPLALAPVPGIASPVISREQVTDVCAGFVADPFLVRRSLPEGGWHMFFEVLNTATELGEVGLAESRDGLAWEYRRIVLREPFHLSYPYVFAHAGEHYMIPESLEAGSIRLYRAAAFPEGWELVRDLVPGRFADPSPVQAEGRWFLFACDANGRHDTLRLFLADDLTGPWREHPRSPLVRGDARSARPAGRLCRWQDRLFRFAQDCRPYYGRQVRAFEILELTPDRYREREAPESPVLTPGEGWNAAGMHHLDPQPDGVRGWLAAVDGRADSD
ncbi:MAG TPA: hypothetical protein VEW48_19730 [Thermoanaerobaculia bacterium]|nr:hypothetical protein [Thermoanaerobaculia bacterium]